MLNTDIVIVGAGVSGMTSALYLKRAKKEVILIENSVPGGQLTKIPKIENYPGFMEIAGPDLAMNIYEQVINVGVDYKYGNISSIEKDNESFIVHTDKDVIKCNKVILATGRYPRKLGLENEEKLIGRGISYCALCDGNFFKNKDVAVVGGGDSALSEALYLSNICNKVYIIYRKDQFKAQQYLIDRVLEKENIIPIYNTIVNKIKGDTCLESIEINNETLKIDGLFIYIGFIPNSEFVVCDKKDNYIIVNNNLETSVKGMYAIGDVIYKNTYQIGTCIGDAINCASVIINKK